MAKCVMLAVAGAGKTYRICHSIDPTRKNLILAFTHENVKNICKELLSAHGCVPELTSVMTFDSFVYRYILSPYEPLLAQCFGLPSFKSKGITIISPPEKSIIHNGHRFANPLYKPKDCIDHYTINGYYYNDTIPELLVYAQSKVKLINKAAQSINRFYSEVLIDEFQDFREFDFDLIIKLSKKINNLTLVGDYYQHSVSGKNNAGKPFKNGSTPVSYTEFINALSRLHLSVDTTTLSCSRRCPPLICEFVTRKLSITINANNDHEGSVIWLNKESIPAILNDNSIPKLVYQDAKKYTFNAINWSYSKGDTMNSACVILTDKFKDIDKDSFSVSGISEITINKLYVALTRTKGNLYLIKQKDFLSYKSQYTK